MIPARRKVGLRDVAKAAGVSTATVSRAMNNPGTVSEELRSRVASVVRHLGRVPDGSARACDQAHAHHRRHSKPMRSALRTGSLATSPRLTAC
jgi:hypothetical protein